jgi:hypothetical protein
MKPEFAMAVDIRCNCSSDDCDGVHVIVLDWLWEND